MLLFFAVLCVFEMGNGKWEMKNERVSHFCYLGSDPGSLSKMRHKDYLST